MVVFLLTAPVALEDDGTRAGTVASASGWRRDVQAGCLSNSGFYPSLPRPVTLF